MKRMIYRGFVVFFLSLFVISGVFIGRYYLESYQNKSAFATLQTQLVAFEKAHSEDDPGEAEAPAQTEWKLEAYQTIAEQNKDMVGWLKIAGTEINYPVMQTPEDPEFYLKRNFAGEDSDAGTPFADAKSDVFLPTDNIIIYAHHMNDGSMFADLIKYGNYDFYLTHKFIEFDTIESTGTYEIFSIFQTDVGRTYTDQFDYYNFIHAEDEAQFDTYIKRAKAESNFDTGVQPVYGDKIISLSTCEYSTADGRMVVMAKKIK